MKSRRPPLNLTESKTMLAGEPGEAEAGSGEAEAPAAPAIEADGGLDIPEPSLTLKPPPETTPPVRTQVKTPKAKEKIEIRQDVTPVKVEVAGVMKATGSSGWLFWGGATVLAALCACGIGAFIFGAQSDISAFSLQPFRLAVIAFLVLLPVGLIFAAAFALRNAAALARQAQRTAALADAMVAPAAAAASQTNDLVDALRAQVDHAVRAVRLAHADINELSNQLKGETERLHEAAEVARLATQSITRAMEQERNAVGQMSASLSVQTGGIIEAVDRQARMVADASDLAQTQLREAETSLATRASDMMNAASDIFGTARTINEDLDRQTQRLETAGAGVSDQIRSVEEGLSQQRAGLVSAALSLRADQEDFAVHIENQRGQLTEALSITRVATVDLSETSSRGIDVLRDIVLSAQEHFRSVMEAAENERTAFETRIHQTLSNISVMAADARDDLLDETRRSLEQLNAAAIESRQAADAAAQTAQARVERLNESIFEASKKADEVFDARFSAARRLIEDSAELIHEAGDQTVEKLDQSFARTTQAITDVNRALGELTASADQLPMVAQERLHDIRRSVEDGLLAMTAAARKAAQETEAVDQVLQDRIKRNYDMLTEAVRLMGVISGDQPGAVRTVVPPMPRPTARVAPQPVAQPAPAAQSTRLRLSPLAAETRPSPGPQPVAPAPVSAGRNDGWSWRDLLNGMEGRGDGAEAGDIALRTYEPATSAAMPPPDAEFDRLDEQMVAEVSAMGVDAAALLGRARVDEVISAIMAEDNEGARNLVRRVAPAAIRRMARRMAGDVELHRQANDFATFYDQQINIGLLSKDPGRSLADLLSNDTGRAYLLLDAALGELI